MHGPQLVLSSRYANLHSMPAPPSNATQENKKDFYYPWFLSVSLNSYKKSSDLHLWFRAKLHSHTAVSIQNTKKNFPNEVYSPQRHQNSVLRLPNSTDPLPPRRDQHWKRNHRDHCWVHLWPFNYQKLQDWQKAVVQSFVLDKPPSCLNLLLFMFLVYWQTKAKLKFHYFRGLLNKHLGLRLCCVHIGNDF